MKWYVQNGKTTNPHPTLWGYRRRNILILLVLVVSLIILIIGLAVGLTRNKSPP
jgi:hypothetical protein